MNTITCTTCGTNIEVDKALEGQIEARVLAAAKHSHEAELIKIREDAARFVKAERETAAAASKTQLAAEKELLQQQLAADFDLAKKKLEIESTSAYKKTAMEQAAREKDLRDDAESEKQANTQLREQLSELMKSLREEKQARANVELESEKKLMEGEDKIRQGAEKAADEKYHLRLLEQEKKLADTQKALIDAQRKASQGSQQNQGEVLELDLENKLREAFPYDTLEEIKKGARGADIKQLVNNQVGVNCGVLLWETKNGKWQPAWVAKFKQDIREASANIGVIVSQEMPDDMGDMKHLEANVWVVKPTLAPVLAAALRATILQVDAANKMNAGKDTKMEALYQFLVGPEFRHRVEAIVENYSLLQNEIEKEKRSAALRWSHQEKAIRAVIDNTIGMYGDLQGITARALPIIASLEPDADDEVDGETQSALL